MKRVEIMNLLFCLWKDLQPSSVRTQEQRAYTWGTKLELIQKLHRGQSIQWAGHVVGPLVEISTLWCLETILYVWIRFGMIWTWNEVVWRLWMYAKQYMGDFLFNCWIWCINDTFLAELWQLYTGYVGWMFSVRFGLAGRCLEDWCMNGCWMSDWIFHLWHVRWVVFGRGVFTGCGTVQLERFADDVFFWLWKPWLGVQAFMKMNFSCNVSSQGRGTQQEDKQRRNTLLCVVLE